MIKNYIRKVVERLNLRSHDAGGPGWPRETREAQWERSRVRWRKAEPEGHLTWGRVINGDGFVAKLDEYHAFGSDRTLLEIGPGYGRLLKSIVSMGLPFKSYLGIDLSDHNVKYLTETFPDQKITFRHEEIETVEFNQTFDSAFSSLTFKHLYPSFEKALQNVARALKPGALAIFDLMEGSAEHFEHDGVTYLRHYTKEDVSKILNRCGLRLFAWDEVAHTPEPEHRRLLVVATRV